MSMKGIVINIRVYTIRPHVCLSLAFRRQRPIYVLYIVANIAEHITLITVSVQSTWHHQLLSPEATQTV